MSANSDNPRPAPLSDSALAASVIEAAPAGVVMVDARGDIVLVNALIEKLFGYPRAQLIGRPVEKLIPDRTRDTHVGLREGFMADPRARQMGEGRSLFGKRADGEEFPIQVGLSPLTTDRGVFVVATVSDLTERRRVERQYELTQRTVDLGADAVFFIREDGSFSYANERAAKFLGYTRDELCQMGVSDINPDYPAERWPEHWEETRRAGLLTLESRHVRKDGTTYDCELRKLFVEYAGERLVVALVRDITAARADRRQLTRSTFAADNASEAIYWCRRDGSFSYVNEAACRMLGYTREELLRRSVIDIDPDYPPDVWEAHWERMRRKRFLEIDTKHVTADGDELLAAMHIHFYEFDGEEFIVATARDVTEQRRAVAAIEASEVRYRTLYEKSPVMHANVDPDDGLIRDCNQRLVDRLGYADKSEVIGRKVFELYDPDCMEGVQKAFRKFVATGAVEDAELTLRTKGGRTVPVVLNVAAVRDPEGKILYSSSTWSDVSEIKRYVAELERANHDLEQFAYIASHDLKSPLRGIDHLAQWLAEDLGDTLTGDSARHLAQLQQRVRRMNTLLGDLLEYSRAGRKRGDVVRVELGALLDDLVALLDLPDGFTVEWNLSVARFDAFQTPLETVLRNLVANAVKHHDRDRGRIVVTAEPCDEGVRFGVADDGPGIPPEFRERAFRLFHTLQPRDDTEGSGMGLSIVQRIVAAEGGRVWIEDAEPRGARVLFTWPRYPQSVWDSDDAGRPPGSLVGRTGRDGAAGPD